MKKIYIPFILSATFFISTSFAQSTTLISGIANCILNSSTDKEINCYQDYLSPSITLDDVVGNWLYINGKGIPSNPRETNLIVYSSEKPFSEGGCDTIMAFNKQKAVQSKTCAPDPAEDSLTPHIQSLSTYTYMLNDMIVGAIQLQQNDKPNSVSNTAFCPLIKLSGTNYLVCKTIDPDTGIKSVLSYKKNS